MSGHVADVPLHVSATSQRSFAFAGRHGVPALPAGCWQVLLMPSHWSSVQGLLSLGQPAPIEAFLSTGQAPAPSQFSAGSQSPCEARQSVVVP